MKLKVDYRKKNRERRNINSMLLKITMGEWKSQRQSEKYIKEMKMEIPFQNLWDAEKQF